MKRRKAKGGKVHKKESLTVTKAIAPPPPVPQEPLVPIPLEQLPGPSELFLYLCRQTSPYETERGYWHDFLLGLGFMEDEHGNYWKVEGEATNTMFCAHLDTADSRVQNTEVFVDAGMAKTKASVLGGDDRAGVTVLLTMLKAAVPGLYYLFLGEERGMKGSSKVAGSKSLGGWIQRAIAFDRTGSADIITHQSGERCCSDEFADAIAVSFPGYTKDNTGSYTDTYAFCEEIPECTNLSVGYYGAHTSQEKQDLAHLEAVCYWATATDWESLPTVRDPSVVEYLNWGYESYNSWRDDDWGSRWATTTTTKDKTKNASYWYEVFQEWLGSGTVDYYDIESLVWESPSVATELLSTLIEMFGISTERILKAMAEGDK